MPKAPSLYVPLDVNYLRDPRIRRAGIEGELLYLRALAYAKGGETDGMVYDYDLDAIASGLKKPEQLAAILVSQGAWEERDGGWFIRAWFRWNEPVERLREQRKKKAEGAAKTNHRKHIDKGVPYVSTCPVCLGDVPPE